MAINGKMNSSRLNCAPLKYIEKHNKFVYYCVVVYACDIGTMLKLHCMQPIKKNNCDIVIYTVAWSVSISTTRSL